MPKVTVSIGERQIQVELDERTTRQVLEALSNYRNNNLIDPQTRQPYAGKAKSDEQISELGKALLGKGPK